MASRKNSPSGGEVADLQQTASSIGQIRERISDDCSRAFGGDGAYDDYNYNHRRLSRSPSPYRRRRTRSPSPYRAKRDTRNTSRSPEPFRHRGSGSHRAHDSRSYNKRKASPPRGSRPDKRHYTDRNRHGDYRPKSRYDESRSYHSGSHNDRKPSKPLSYADNGRSPTVPDFRERSTVEPRFNGAPRDLALRDDESNDQRMKKSSTDVDVEMTQPANEPDLSFDPSAQEHVPTQETREEKRRRWAAIRAAAEKEKGRENLLHQALTNASESTTPNIASPAALAESSESPAGSPRIGDLGSVPASPDVMVVDKQGTVTEGTSPAADSPSAADYDPTKDVLDDHNLVAQKAELSSDSYSETDPKVLSTLPAEKKGPVKKQKKDFDMFDFDDEDDDEVPEANIAEQNTKGTVLDEKLLDNWDDVEGYYKLIANELVNGGRYRMVKNLGRGVFANVAQAEDTSVTDESSGHKLVAIKMIRRNDLMRKASQKELDFLRKVNDADPQDKRHVIRLLGSFDHKGHLCAVFEHMSKNLRDLLKEDTNGHGLSLQAVRTYSRQMFVGLQHLRDCQVVHVDLKPDNILVSPDLKTIKLCDFGTAVDKRDIMERNEEIVSRFYRAPEIILGLEVGYGIDMWAIACTIYELWTGKILFTGRTNNQMIKAFIDCLGWPTEKLLKKALPQNVSQHFEAGPPLKFISKEVDQYGNVLAVRKIEQQKKIPRDLKSRINNATRGMTEGKPAVHELNDLVELLTACLNFNPEKRFQPKEALAHRFFPQSKLIPRPHVVKPSTVKRPASSIKHR